MISHRLVLHPSDPMTAPQSTQALVQGLALSGLIGDVYPQGGEYAFFSGAEFLQLISFLGCSPHMALLPGESEDPGFCYVSLTAIKAWPKFILGQHPATSRCPNCSSPAVDWQNNMDPGSIHVCTSCEIKSPIHALNWKRSAGYGRVFIEIYGVHPHEAVPADHLLESLHTAHGIAWDYCYL